MPRSSHNIGADSRALPDTKAACERNRAAGQASVVIVGALVICLAFAGLAVDGARLFTGAPRSPERRGLGRTRGGVRDR